DASMASLYRLAVSTGMIFFLGTQDKIIPVETARRYKEAMEASGNRCELILYENQEHGFFNHKNPEFYRNTVYETDRFLRSLKLLRGKPTIPRGTPGQPRSEERRVGKECRARQ